MTTTTRFEPTSTTRALTKAERNRARNVGIAYFLLAALCLLFFTRSSGSADFGVGDGKTLGVPSAALAWLAGISFAILGGAQLARGFGRWTNVLLAAASASFVITFLAWAAAGHSFDFSGMLQDAVSRSVPLTFGAMAGVLCERSGVINIAIEGMLLGGAFVGTVVGSTTNQWLAVISAGLIGALLGALLAVLAIKFMVDQVIVGFAINFFVLGLTSFLDSRVLTKNAQYNQVEILHAIKIPLLSKIPVIGEALFDQTLFVYASFALVFVLNWALFRTRWGLRTRAVGEHPLAADTLGVKVLRVRYRNVILGGAVAGIGGAWWPVGYVGRFDENITGGRGFIALAALIFGRWNPIGAFVAALVFGLSDAAAGKLAILNTGIPTEFLQMTPYIVTIVVVAGFIGHSRPPAADGKPYESQ